VSWIVTGVQTCALPIYTKVGASSKQQIKDWILSKI